MSKFKNSMGRRLLQGLFFETTLADKSSVVYSLKNEDHSGYPSLYRLYMEAGDEYLFAVSHLDGYAHWVELCECKWFTPYLTAWRAELEAKQKSEYRGNIRAVAADPRNPSAFQANKYLLDALEKPVEAKKRGRPTRGSQDLAETHQRALQAEINQDAIRLGLTN